jgi:hypothetical protein
MRGVMLLAVIMMLTLTTYDSAQAQAQPELVVLEPAQDMTVQGSSLTVTFQTTGFQIVASQVPVEEAGKRPEANRPGEGHLHLMLDLQPVVIWETTEPYTFENVTPGVHQLSVELVNNDHSSLSPPVIVQRRITLEASAQAPADASAPAAASPPAQDMQHEMLPATGPGSWLRMSEQRILLFLAALHVITFGVFFRLQVVSVRHTPADGASRRARLWNRSRSR